MYYDTLKGSGLKAVLRSTCSTAMSKFIGNATVVLDNGERRLSVPAPAAKHEPDSERQIVGRHVSGDSTYVMFSDGTVEAHTPDGVLHFASLDELRAYADERDAANPERS